MKIMNIKCFFRLLTVGLLFISCNVFADEKSTKTDAPTIGLYKEVLRNIPFAAALCSKAIQADYEENCFGELMQGLAVLIAQNSDAALNEPLIELAELYFGASS
jgi:hypothetical protein